MMLSNPHPTPVFLPGESQGRGSLVGCCLWGRTESDTTEATSQPQQPGYTVEVTNKFKGFRSDRVSEELWMEVHKILQEQ